VPRFAGRQRAAARPFLHSWAEGIFDGFPVPLKPMMYRLTGANTHKVQLRACRRIIAGGNARWWQKHGQNRPAEGSQDAL
jgi:hypothetical protein